MTESWLTRSLLQAEALFEPTSSDRLRELAPEDNFCKKSILKIPQNSLQDFIYNCGESWIASMSGTR
jgi:hypothetical protein